jgi:hypothetical protein
MTSLLVIKFIIFRKNGIFRISGINHKAYSVIPEILIKNVCLFYILVLLNEYNKRKFYDHLGIILGWHRTCISINVDIK